MTLYAMVSTESSKRYTDFALESFFAATALAPDDRFTLIVNDGCYEPPQSLRGAAIEVLYNQRPLSFAENANLAAVRARTLSSDLFFLNNDIIFSSGWNATVKDAPPDALLVPLSNREMQYTLPLGSESAFTLRMRMELDEYLGHERDFAHIAELHEKEARGAAPFLAVLCAPFYAVRVPLAVINDVGAFDTRDGVGGAEDYDYCLRAHLAGYAVGYLQRGYLLHFGGRSIQASGQSEPTFIGIFRDKWGGRMTRVVFDDASTVIEEENVPRYDYQKEGFGRLVRELAPLPPIRLPL